MPTRWPLSKGTTSTLAITFAALAITWESFKGPSWLGWLCIIASLGLVLLLEKPRPTPMRWPLLLLILMSLLSLLVSADPQLTGPQVDRLLASIAGFVALVTWARDRQRLLVFSLALIGVGTLIAAAAPFIVRWNLAKGIPVPGFIYQGFPLLVADAVHPNVMVSVMVLLMPLSLAYLMLSPSRELWPLSLRWTRLLLLFSVLMMSLVLLLTKSRGGYIAGAVGVLLVLWLARRRILALVSGSLILIVGLLLMAGPEQQTTSMAGELADPSTLAFRLQVWDIASRVISDFPYTGVGMGAFNNAAMRLYPFSEVANPGAHNLYFQVGVDLGIPGLIAFMAISVLALYMSISTLAQMELGDGVTLRALAVGLLAGMTALLIHGLIDITVWGTRVVFLPWAIIALVTAVHLLVKPQRPK